MSADQAVKPGSTFDRLHAKMKSAVLPSPPLPDQVEPLRGVPEDLAAPSPAMPDNARLHEAAAGDLAPANDAPKVGKPRKMVRTRERKSEQGRTADGYKQLSGRVTAEVHLQARSAAMRLGVDVGEILTEALDLWHKKHDPKR